MLLSCYNHFSHTQTLFINNITAKQGNGKGPTAFFDRVYRFNYIYTTRSRRAFSQTANTCCEGTNNMLIKNLGEKADGTVPTAE
jgi:hypothetical protein